MQSWQAHAASLAAWQHGSAMLTVTVRTLLH